MAVETFVDAMMAWSSNEAQTTADEDNASALRKKMEAVGDESGTPKQKVMLTDCGEL